MADTQSTTGLTNCISHTEWACSDPAATLKFFQEAFGYQFTNHSSPMGDYHIAQLPNGAGLAVRQVNAEGGEPVGSTPYITVDDLDAAGARIKSAGGTAMMEDHAIAGRGRMSWYMVPGSGFIAIWKDDTKAE